MGLYAFWCWGNTYINPNNRDLMRMIFARWRIDELFTFFQENGYGD